MLNHFKTILKLIYTKYVKINLLAASADLLPERLGKSAQIRVLRLASDRAELTENVVGISAQIR